MDIFLDMLLLASNLKYLRKVMQVSQQEVADFVGLANTAISGYEKEKFYPAADVIAKLCQFFQINADDLLFKDLSVDSNRNLEAPAIPSVIKGNNVLVPLGAQVKYVEDWDSEFYRKLTFVNVPGVEGDARTFEVSGNSMNPLLLSGDFVACVARKVTEMQAGTIYAIITNQIHICPIQLEHERVLCMPANREEFDSYYINTTDIKEVWEVKVRLTDQITDPRQLYGNVERKMKVIEEFFKNKFPEIILE